MENTAFAMMQCPTPSLTAIEVEYRRLRRAVTILKMITARLGLRYSTSKTVELWVCQNTVLGRSGVPPARSARYLTQCEPRLRALLHKQARCSRSTQPRCLGALCVCFGLIKIKVRRWREGQRAHYFHPPGLISTNFDIGRTPLETWKNP